VKILKDEETTYIQYILAKYQNREILVKNGIRKCVYVHDLHVPLKLKILGGLSWIYGLLMIDILLSPLA